MRRVMTTFRCVPRYGYDYAAVRTIDVDLVEASGDRAMLEALNLWFAGHGVADAVYDIDYDDDGCFVIVNDEAYLQNWGEELL